MGRVGDLLGLSVLMKEDVLLSIVLSSIESLGVSKFRRYLAHFMYQERLEEVSIGQPILHLQ